MRHGDRERYTLQRLTASHHGTRGQREVHITVSHSITSDDLTTERGAHYSVSQHHIGGPDDRERKATNYSVSQHQIVRPGDREVNITVSHSTTLYDLTTERHIKVSHSSTSYDQTTDRGNITLSHSITS